MPAQDPQTGPRGPLHPGREEALRAASPAPDDLEARRARAAVESRLFDAPSQRVSVGRYRISGRLGAGGMGVVYRAHDPELARDVAVKVLNPEGLSAEAVETARARLVREARAMARLADPNVIHVYDVGTLDDGVFVAMELVEGHSLDSWLARSTRPWREVLGNCLAAGRGLAAAHAAGVVHRDFKPENVLVGDDGRVRVVDFGLAAGAVGAVSGIPVDTGTGPIPLDDAVGTSLTRTGAVLGTPMYMAPELYRGEGATAKSDQFAFCVATYQALYGVPAFEGDTISAYRHNVLLGNVNPPPPGSEVPGWVHGEIVRGLAVDPEGRHPDMAALLERLQRAVERPAPRWRLPALVVALLATAGAAGFVWLDSPSPETGPSAEVTAPSKNPAVADPTHPAGDPPPAPAVGTVPPEPAPDAPPGNPSPAEPAPPEPSPEPVPGEPGGSTADPTTKAPTPAAAKPRPAAWCYWGEDGNKSLGRRRGGAKRKLVIKGQCYTCRPHRNPRALSGCTGTGHMACAPAEDPTSCD